MNIDFNKDKYEKMVFWSVLKEMIMNGHTSGFQINLCLRWGYSLEESQNYLDYFVDSGILSKKLMIYDPEDDAFDAFEEFDEKIDLTQLDVSKFHWLYTPTELAIIVGG